MNNIDMGVSEGIYSAINREIIASKPSPIIMLRALKNEVEREGMREAHIKDAVAMCDTLSYLEERYLMGDTWKEAGLALEFDRARHEQDRNNGLSFKTTVAFGPNGVKTNYHPTNQSSLEITNENLLLIDCGGQYLTGTTR